MKKIIASVLAALLVLTMMVPALAEVTLGQSICAAHGTKCFAVITVAMDGDKIAAAYIDEFQPMDPATTTPVPNAASIWGTEGNLLGIPTGVSFNGYLVNVDILEAAGYTLADLTSFEKIAQIATEAVEKDLCKYGISFASGVDLVDMLTMQGVDIVDADNGYSGNATKSVLMEGKSNAALTKAANIIAELVRKGVALDYGYGADCAAIFKSNNLLFWKCTNSSTHNIFTSSSSIRWAFIPSVGVDENAEFKGCALSEGTGIFICNTGNEKEMQGAYEFLKHISKAENQFQFTTGIGYVPYTLEATEIYMPWAEENFPSASNILEMLKNSPAELGLPFVDVGGEINIAMGDLIGDIAAYPDGDVASFIEDASNAIDNGLKIYAMRNEGA